ncbi:MAG: ABC transporter ATP-binding protein [Eubacteriales bacterium]|nr:ABC transporter ATP-binding protein [Eubacteriales bacterium]
MTPLIDLENITFTYPGAGQASLNNISMSISPGECVLVTGQSGCGKSTLTRILNGLCPKFYEGSLRGRYLLDGRDIGNISLDEIGNTLGSVFQDPRSQFFCKYVRDELVLAMENNCVPRAEMQERLLEVSELLGIEKLSHREMRTLSSGEKQKVAIASVFAMRPAGLVLDEPSANLDTNATAQLGTFLAQLKRNGHTLVVSEHRLYYLRDIFDRLIVLKDGEIIAEYTRAEALSLTPKELRSMGLRMFDAPEFSVDRSIREYKNSPIRGERLSLRLNDTQILHDVDVGAANGRVTAITGSNGAGKTSLCRVLTGLQKESSGMVYLNEQPTKRKARIKHTFFVQQDVDYQLYTPSVETEILMASSVSKADPLFSDTVRYLGLENLLERHPNTLSGGQKQRVLIAAAILRDAPVMVLDEPTSGLDGHHMREVGKILRQIAADGKSVLLITHDTEFIHEAADSIVYMDRSKVSYHRELIRE